MSYETTIKYRMGWGGGWYRQWPVLLFGIMLSGVRSVLSRSYFTIMNVVVTCSSEGTLTCHPATLLDWTGSCMSL